jgi:hypothetical protein
MPDTTLHDLLSDAAGTLPPLDHHAAQARAASSRGRRRAGRSVGIVAAVALCVIGLQLVRTSGTQERVSTGTATPVTPSDLPVGPATVRLSGGMEVSIVRGAADGQRVVVTAADDVRRDVTVVANATDIEVSRRSPKEREALTVKVTIAVTEMPSLTVTGGVTVDVVDLRQNEPLAVTVTGGCHITGHVEAGPMTVNASGGVNVALTGRVPALRFDATGGVLFDLHSLNAETVTGTAKSGSSVFVTALVSLGPLTVHSGSTLTYLGNPQTAGFDADVSSTIRRGT